MQQHLRSVFFALAAGLLVLAGACDSGGDNDEPGTDIIATDIVETPDTGGDPDVGDPTDVPTVADIADDTTTAVDVAEDIDPNAEPAHRREAYEVPTGSLNAGVAFGYLDGPVGTSMAGYGGRLGLVTPWAKMLGGTGGFYNAQHIKVMVLDVDGERVVLIKMPTMSGETTVTYGIIRKVQELYGIDLTGRVLTGMTHSHHATARYWRIPSALGLIGADEADDEVQERMFEDVAHVVKAALDDLAPAEWGYTYEDGWDEENHVYNDRRGENDAVYGKDPRLTLLAVRRPDGTPMATILNFGMHGTKFDKDNVLFTEDAPGAVELAFEDYFYAQEDEPILGMFIQSGGADAAPAGGRHSQPHAAPGVESVGLAAAPKIYELYQQIQWQTEATVAIRSRLIDLRYDWMGYDENHEFEDENGTPYTWGALQCCTDPYSEEETWEGKGKDCLDVGWLLELLQVGSPFEPLHQTYLTTARIGPLFLVSLPGETAYSIINYVREQIAERSTEERPLDVLVFGYSQDHLLYMTSYDDWFYGGYETAGGLWGPLQGEYLANRQMQFVDDMLEGYNKPTFYEEFPRLSEEPYDFEPRPYEASLEAATIFEDVPDPAEVGRGHTIHFAWNGGDPGLRSPLVIVEAMQEDGSYEPVPSPSGHPGQALDNTRSYMVTRYDPNPAQSANLLEERQHIWRIAWQVPPDFPAGTYRLLATGRYFDGTDIVDYEVASSDFGVVNADDLTNTAELADGSLVLSIMNAYQTHEGTKAYSTAGWRVFDPSLPAGEPFPLRAPVDVELLVNGDQDFGPFTLTYDETAGGYVLDWDGNSLPADPTSIELTWSLSADLEHLGKKLQVSLD